MKRSIVVLVVLAAVVAGGAVCAQETGLVAKGVKVGLSMYSFGGEDADDMLDGWSRGSRPGLAVGGFLTFRLGPNLALQPELLYVMKGARYERDADRFKFDLDYLDFPVLLKYRFATAGATRPCLFAGPVASALLSARLSTYVLANPEGPHEMDITFGVRDFDFGFAVGGGLDFAMSGSTITIDARYVFPLTRWSDYIENEDPEFDNHGLLVAAGVGF